ncbi:MAG: hypothetical protein WBA74_21295 [Cyclobacteriaceae bacterium]
MSGQITNIWIESEETGAIIDGTLESNDNSDVIVTFEDGDQYVATFFTYQNIKHLRMKNKETGECMNGKYFWASDMIIFDKIDRNEIEEIIDHLIKEEEFSQVFKEQIDN